MNQTNPARVFPQLRLWWMSRMFVRYGTLSRLECCVAWGISEAQVSADFAALKAAAPALISYDTSTKVYRWTGEPSPLPAPPIVAQLLQLLAADD